jgi:hypothetical protein
MRTRLRAWWPAVKALFTVAILVAVGRQFARDLGSNPELWQRPFHPGLLAAAAGLYVCGLAFSGFYWYRLLRGLRQRPAGLGVLRAYALGHLGKYLPGKAWALLLRVGLVRGPEVRLGVATLTSFYEVLTTMAAGVLLASVVFALQAPDLSLALDWRAFRRLFLLQPPDTVGHAEEGLLLLALALLAVLGIPILPVVFNRLVRHLSLPFRDRDREPLPPVRTRLLVEGLLLTACGWLLLGTSLWVVVCAVLGQAPPWSWGAWGRYAAYTALGYVAGFVILVVPGGLGVREFFLTLFLVPELARLLGPDGGEARATTVLVVLLLRLLWTTAEVLVAGIVYWLPGPAGRMTDNRG